MESRDWDGVHEFIGWAEKAWYIIKGFFHDMAFLSRAGRQPGRRLRTAHARVMHHVRTMEQMEAR